MEYSDDSLFEMLEEIDDLGINVTDFEAEFIESVFQRIDRGKVVEFSERQRAVILEMKAKYLA
jgi:hypothetical protein